MQKKPRIFSAHSKPAKRWAFTSALFGLEPPVLDKEMLILLGVVFVVISVWHMDWCRLLFENLRWWSTRTLLQKEVSFYSEQAMYYRYFKKAVSLPLTEVWSFFTSDQRIQYPDIVNPLKQFNVYPELIFSVIYKAFPYREPIDFYVSLVHLLNGAFFGFVFVLGCLVAGNIWGGLFSAVCFLYNYTQSTRAYWSPSLRESIAMPFFFAQICVLTFYFRHKEWTARLQVRDQKLAKDGEEFPKRVTHSGFKNTNRILISVFSLFTFIFALCWQFAAFALLTQVTAFLIMYLLDYLERKEFMNLLFASGFSVLCVAGAQFGNEMLLNSVYLSVVVVALCLCFFVPKSLLVGPPDSSTYFAYILKLFRVILTVIVLAVSALFLKLGTAKAFGIKDDGHIFDIFRSKLDTLLGKGNPKESLDTFHTTLYLKQKAFQAIDYETMYDVLITLLAPAAFLAFFLVLLLLLSKDKSKTLPAHLVYNWLQFTATGVMAAMIMRLKAFWFPYCAIMVGMLWSKEIRQVIEDSVIGKIVHNAQKKRYYTIFGLIILLLLMSVVGLQNVHKQYSEEMEYSHPELQDFMLWISKNTPKDAVFAGDMVTMSTVTLVTDRIICNHPHYESEEIRNRTFDVYSITTCKSPKTVYDILKKIGVQYLELSQKSCLKGEVFAAECSFDQRFCQTIDTAGKQLFTKLYDCNCEEGFKVYKLK